MKQACTIDCKIRLIQLWAWVGLGETLAYTDVQCFLVVGYSETLTPTQKNFISTLLRKIDKVESCVRCDDDRFKVYHNAGLITGRKAFERVFYPRDYDERFGGFGNDLSSPEWCQARAHWEKTYAGICEEIADQNEKQDKHVGSTATPLAATNAPSADIVRGLFLG